MNEAMMQLAAELSARHRLGMITDNAADRMAALIAQHSLDTLFDPIVISANVGSQKDSPEIFEYALRLVGSKPSECVFIDNQARNLTVPASLGFKTHLFDPKADDIEAFRRRLSEWGARVSDAHQIQSDGQG